MLGVEVDPVSVAELHASIRGFVREEGHAVILHANVYGLNLCYHDPELRSFFKRLAILLRRVIVPGANVVVASNPLLAHIVAGAMGEEATPAAVAAVAAAAAAAAGVLA